MQKIDPTNHLFALASDLVRLTSRNIFLTGKAGTGKTTFLKYIREKCLKQMVVVAPTGVAAINAGGVTIHSFFQLPFSPFVPGATPGFPANDEVSDKHSLLSRLRLNSERRKIIQELELLIIDEISMVRCDVLDSIDLVLRHVRHKHSEKFGGVQVLFIGDMFQLPPVVKEQEWGLLKHYYKSPYFFDSHVLRDDPPVYLELSRIYRQTEEKFINLLNRVRNNEMDEEGLASLHERYDPRFFSAGADGYILLTTHNESARNKNAAELDKLKGPLHSYKANVENDFPSTAWPADDVLHLKVGAQVMFIKNDAEKGRRYFNGKIGVVFELDDDKITVQCKGEEVPVEVKREKWENIRYTLNKSTRQLDEDLLGTFSQFPLRLAWAITIHKSQGLTFEKAVIDAGEAFAPGQVYVALSRCTSLEGLVLHSRVNTNRFYTDSRIVQFSRSVMATNVLEQELEAAKKDYWEKIILSLFEFERSLQRIKDLCRYLAEAKNSFNEEVMTWSEGLLIKFTSIEEIAGRFRIQLRKLFAGTANLEENPELPERLKAASNYFCDQLKRQLDYILQSPAVTDSRLHAKDYNEALKEIFSLLAQQCYLLQGFMGKFEIEAFYRRKKSFVLPAFTVNAYATASEAKVDLMHPALYFRLKKLRDSICSKRNLPIYMVASSKTLEEMVSYLPASLAELEEISGFGKARIQSFGNEFLAIINEYAAENNLSSSITLKKPGRKRKDRAVPSTDTKAETLKLYREGKSIKDIAAERKLAIQTIEGHLAHYVQTGHIGIDQLISREKIIMIEPVVKNSLGKPIKVVKSELGEKASFGEIRLVLASLEYQSGQRPI